MVASDRQTLGRLQADQRRLEAVIGRLDLKDLSQFAVVAIQTDEPYHVAWRFFSPEDQSIMMKIETASGGQGSVSGTVRSQSETVIRSRFTFEDNSVRHFVRTPSGALTSAMFGAEGAKFFKAHWDQLQIEGVGFEGTETFDPEEVIEWLRVTIPKELLPKAAEAIGRDAKTLETQPLILLRLGTPEAFEDAEQRPARRR